VGVGSKSPLGEAFPQFTEVLTASEDLVGLNDSISSVEERGATLLKFHRVHYEPNRELSDHALRGSKECDLLDDKGVTVFGYKRFSLASTRVLSRPIEVAFWYGSVLKNCRRE